MNQRKLMALENGVFSEKLYNLYTERTNPGHAMRKSPGHISLVRALAFILCKEDPPNFYKIESALESDKLCFNGWINKIMYFDDNLCNVYTKLCFDTLYIQR
jgi:hypothetical protein